MYLADSSATLTGEIVFMPLVTRASCDNSKSSVARCWCVRCTNFLDYWNKARNFPRGITELLQEEMQRKENIINDKCHLAWIQSEQL